MGDNVKRLRLEKGLSQDELAAKAGLDRTYVNGIERGRKNPSIVSLWHISQALGCKPRDLIDHET